ncbi:MAG: endonuclease/exonuclease/phosphatase family protein [Candidatus Pacebacteria bacterium]|nr:endonuclease/exonuclease/phosphatase family protein [Candidatus Paceibacterota bacterium]
MRIKTLQWNIGGGKARKPEDDPADALSYRFDVLDEFAGFIARQRPDIITLQETHSDEESSQAQKIAQTMRMFFINDVYDKSHIEDGKGLGQAIISRFPIRNHTFDFFYNPKAEALGPDGKHWVSHDKGVTACFLTMDNGLILNVKASHSLPFRKFNIDPLSDGIFKLRAGMDEKLRPESDLYLCQADLNYDNSSIADFLPGLLRQGAKEVILSEPTTPEGRRYDHVLYKGLKLVSAKVVSDVLSDHFPIVCEFETL